MIILNEEMAKLWDIAEPYIDFHAKPAKIRDDAPQYAKDALEKCSKLFNKEYEEYCRYAGLPI